MEEWKAIPGTDGKIEVSNEGRVRSLLRGKPYVLKLSTDGRKGYRRVCITLNGVKKHYSIHREVAKAFIPNPSKLPQVNHIDGNKDNNSADNLEWCTNEENARHAIRNGLWKNVFDGAKRENESRKKPVIATKDEKTIRFESISEAEKTLGTKHICAVLKGERSHAKGWTFSYERG